jgi:hypothetical protein
MSGHQSTSETRYHMLVFISNRTSCFFFIFVLRYSQFIYYPVSTATLVRTHAYINTIHMSGRRMQMSAPYSCRTAVVVQLYVQLRLQYHLPCAFRWYADSRTALTCRQRCIWLSTTHDSFSYCLHVCRLYVCLPIIADRFSYYAFHYWCCCVWLINRLPLPH